MVVVALGKDAPLNRRLQPGGFVLFERVQVVEPLEEKQVGDLLDDFQRVGDAAGPEGVPDAVDLVTDFVGEHNCWLRFFGRWAYYLIHLYTENWRHSTRYGREFTSNVFVAGRKDVVVFVVEQKTCCFEG